MKETAGKLVKEMNELKELCMKTMFDSDALKYADEKSIVLYVKMFNLLGTSNDYLTKQAETIDEMNHKLDKLLSK